MTSKQDRIKEPRIDSDTRKRVLACLVCGLSFAMLWFIPLTGKPLGKILREMQDHFARTDTRLQAQDDMVLLGIDADSLAVDAVSEDVVASSPILQGMKSQWPWSRSVYAEVIDRLAMSGAKLIVIDVVLSGARDAEGDAALEQALEKHRGKVILASAFIPSEDGGQMRVVEPKDEFLGPLDDETVTGFVNYRPDAHDRLVRRADFKMTLGGMNGLDPHPDEPVFLSLAAAAATSLGVDIPSERKRFQMALEGENAAEIYRPYSLYTLFVEDQWKARYQEGDFFKDKIVFIGPTSPLFQDSHETVGGRIHGVQLHMQVLTALRAKAWYQEGLLGGGSFYTIVLFVLGLSVAVVCALRWSRTATMTLCAVVFIALWFLAEHMAVPVGNVLLGSLAVVSTAVGGFAGAIIWQAMAERARRQQLHRHLQRSMSPDVADAIVKAPEGYYRAATGNRRNVTVLFADVRNFTQRSEQQDAGELVSQLNEYLGRMVEVIFDHGGTVDKFIGDAIMATWGALDDRDVETQNERAMAAAQGMIVSLAELNEEWKQSGKDPFAIGIGVHLGEAIVGEVGSDQRTDFTVIGDAVNLASRIEGMTKAMGLDLLLTDAVVGTPANDTWWRNVGEVRVKGREEGVTLLTQTRGTDEDWAQFSKALSEFQSGHFTNAFEMVGNLQGKEGFQGLVSFYQSQITSIAPIEKDGGQQGERVGPSDWDGILRMDTK